MIATEKDIVIVLIQSTVVDKAMFVETIVLPSLA